MIKCNHCQYKYEYTGKPCPVCGSEPIITKSDMDEALLTLESASVEKDVFKMMACRRLLADGGDLESMREYARLVEHADVQQRDIDTAMNYYYLAAKLGDPYSAYRYSRLVGRISESAANFWLKFASVLGSIDAYPETAELFSSEGKEEIASYYYSLAAACDDMESIVTMAKRWSMGIGNEANVSYAKWYLDKITIPPISAIKLAYKIRSVRAEEPPKLSFPDYLSYIKELSAQAASLRYPTAEFYLTSILAHSGNINAEGALGIMLIEGKGCEKNIERGRACLESNIRAGNPASALYLGEEYLSAKSFERDVNTALAYFTKAAELGYTNAYEKIGDIHRAGELVEKNVSLAIDYYERAATGGCASARAKATELKAAREKFYLDAYKIISIHGSVTSEEAFSAFRSAAIATAMGEVRAMPLLAKCYAAGFGTEKDRKSAYFWFKAAADAGNTDGCYSLALCYSRGYGTAFSYKNAVRYLKWCQNAGIRAAASELDKLYRRRMKKMVRSLYSSSMSLIHQKKYSEAARLLISFESLAYPKALYTLGCLYEFGRGVPRSDRARASQYYERAATGNPTFGNFRDPASDYKLKILKMIR